MNKVYSNSVSPYKTMALIYKNDIDYVLAYGNQHEKFDKTELKLVCKDKENYLYKIPRK